MIEQNIQTRILEHNESTNLNIVRSIGTSAQLAIEGTPLGEEMNTTHELIKCALGIWLSSTINDILDGPEPNWDTDGIKAGSNDLINISLGEPRLPMLLERGVRFLLAEVFSERPFGLSAAGTWTMAKLAVHSFPFRRSHPWFENEPMEQKAHVRVMRQ